MDDYTDTKRDEYIESNLNSIIDGINNLMNMQYSIFDIFYMVGNVVSEKKNKQDAIDNQRDTDDVPF